MKTPIKKGIAVICASMFCAYATFATAADQKASASSLVGVWKIVSGTNTNDGATKVGSYGEKPNGRVIYTASGHYASIGTRDGLPSFKSGSRMTGTAEENQAIVQGSNSNFGRYSVTPDGKAVVYHVEGGTWTPWNGTDQKRELVLTGDEMTQTITSSYGGTSVLKYQRVK
jgi:Lipocalin-like domain